jgi:hypothetical protein
MMKARAETADARRTRLESAFKAVKPHPKTAMEKTSEVAKELIDTETRKRDEKTAALRAARLAQESDGGTDGTGGKG